MSLKEAINLPERNKPSFPNYRIQKEPHLQGTDSLSSPSAHNTEDCVPIRSAVSGQNTFYIPPIHPKPVLRAPKSMGASQMRRAYTSASLSTDAQSGINLPSNGVKSRRSPEIRSPPSSLSIRSPPSSMPPIMCRCPITCFALCSPPDAIGALPLNSPDPAASKPGLRSKKSSAFMTASASLRVIFGREGFVGRSLSHALDADEISPNVMRQSELKSKISCPLVAFGSTLSPTARESVRRDNRAWRESVLNQAISLSISSRLNKRAEATETEVLLQRSGSQFPVAIPREPIFSTGQAEAESLDVGHESAASGWNGTDPTSKEDTVPNDVPQISMKMGRILKQIGKEDSMASASV